MATATISERVVAGDDSLYEMIDGCIQEKDVGALATWVMRRLWQRLDPFVEGRHLGITVPEMLFVLDAMARLKRRPDLAFVAAAQWPIDQPPPDGDWELVPELAIEVLSPGNPFHEVLAKIREYFAHGVIEVWLIVPEERLVYVYRSPTDVRVLTADDSLKTELLPGWSVSVADIVPATSIQESGMGVNGE